MGLSKDRRIITCFEMAQMIAKAMANQDRGHRAKVAELDPLWQESGGELSQDPRFYIIPLEEYRKPIEEIKSQKRSQYRKRYDLLDQYAEEVKANLITYLK